MENINTSKLSALALAAVLTIGTIGTMAYADSHAEGETADAVRPCGPGGGQYQELSEEERAEREAAREAIRSAIESGDYAAFSSALTEDGPLSEIDTQAEFDLFLEANELREAGDKEAAREIMNSLGIEKPKGKHGFGHRDNEEPHGPHEREEDDDDDDAEDLD